MQKHCEIFPRIDFISIYERINRFLAQEEMLLALSLSILIYRVSTVFTAYLIIHFQVRIILAIKLSILTIASAGTILYFFPNLWGILIHQLLMGAASALSGPVIESGTRQQSRHPVFAGGLKNALRALSTGIGFILGAAFAFQEATRLIFGVYALNSVLMALLLVLRVLKNEGERKKKFSLSPSEFLRFTHENKGLTIVLLGIAIAAIGQQVGTHWLSAFTEEGGILLGLAAVISAAIQIIGSAVVQRNPRFNPWIIFWARTSMVLLPLILVQSNNIVGFSLLVLLWSSVQAGPIFTKHVTSGKFYGAKLDSFVNSVAGLLASVVMPLAIWSPMTLSVIGAIGALIVLLNKKEHLPKYR